MRHRYFRTGRFKVPHTSSWHVRLRLKFKKKQFAFDFGSGKDTPTVIEYKRLGEQFYIFGIYK